MLQQAVQQSMLSHAQLLLPLCLLNIPSLRIRPSGRHAAGRGPASASSLRSRGSRRALMTRTCGEHAALPCAMHFYACPCKLGGLGALVLRAVHHL